MTQQNLFNTHTPPLAQRMRPQKIEDIVGQEHVLAPDKPLYRAIINDTLGNYIFWGPPGIGKTTIASVIAHTTKRTFVSFNAVFNGTKDVKEIIEQSEERIKSGMKSTILFVDEIHRFNKAQQDAFLQPVERGTLILMGATTENPSFEINAALLSRCTVYTLNPLEDPHIGHLVDRTLEDRENGLASHEPILETDARSLLINYANGDARVALTALDHAVQTAELKNNHRVVTLETMQSTISGRHVAFDKGGEEHYNLISALHKSLRDSDVQAALYWLARMIEGGADPLYIVRRLIRFASEDIGLADPNALVQAVAAQQATHFLGYPECDVALAQCVIYLATAPKSNKTYTAIGSAKKAVAETRNDPVPLHIRNAPTKLMRNLGYGKGYKYEHEESDAFSGQSFLPEKLGTPNFYTPSIFGFEKEIQKRLDYWALLKKRMKEE
ncbi:TPA: AAA family ATPase [Candidatus Dependentiae bacterium]|nr:MAG: AAA ATPase central domain protein [candidate division TM6 bacterium GW2011_GWF2_43_87]HBL98219.1 AAA family ATPase [Candidatus Dependentiae bacterium]